MKLEQIHELIKGEGFPELTKEDGKFLCADVRESSAVPCFRQIFRVPYREGGKAKQAEEEMWKTLGAAILYSRGSESLSAFPNATYRTLEGMRSLWMQTGKLPLKWHIEHLCGRWFSKSNSNSGFHQIVCECWLVVDEWKNEALPV